MAQVEPMDIDVLETDFDNKENAFHSNNVLSRTPCTEKGYEELDVSELNMKLRYSTTPASSPMSKSFTGPCVDNKNSGLEDCLRSVVGVENTNLTRSLNSTLTKTESLAKSNILPLQTLSTDPIFDSSRNSTTRRLIDSTNVIISADKPYDVDDNLSLPSTCSSVPDSPEVTTPTKEIPKPEGSPIMRGLKSVLNMFRPSQSPISSSDDKSNKNEIYSPTELNRSEAPTVKASTPVSTSNQRGGSSSKRSSPLKEKLIFNDDLERELQWKDETTIIFKDERIPVQKLLFQTPVPNEISTVPKHNTTVEHMDISNDVSSIDDKIITKIEPNEESVENKHPLTSESDNEFLDCETTFTKTEFDLNKLDIGNDRIVIENATVDSANNAATLQELKSNCKNISDNPASSTLQDLTTYTEQLPVTIKVVPQLFGNNTNNIIEATINLLNSERIYYDKIAVAYSAYKSINLCLKTEPQINIELHLEDPHTSICVDEHITSNNEISDLNTKTLTSFNVANCLASFDTSQDAENREAENQACSDSPKDMSRDFLHTKENSCIVQDISVRDNCAFDNRAITIGKSDITGAMSNIERYMPNHSETTELVKLKSNIDIATKHEDATFVIENEILVDKILNDTASTSINCVGNLGENHETTQDMDVTLSTQGEENMPNTFSFIPFEKDLNRPTNLQTSQSEYNTLNISNNGSLSILPESNITEENNDDKNKHVLKNNMASTLPLNLDCKEDDNTQTSHSLVSDIAVVNNISDNNHGTSDLTVKSDMIFSNTSSEIPLLDDANIEQNILESHSIYNEACKKQGNEMCEQNIVMAVEKGQHSGSEKSSSIGGDNERIGIIDNAFDDKKVDLQTCLIENAHVDINESITINTNTETIMKDKLMSDLQNRQNIVQHAENSSNDINEGTYSSVDGDDSKMRDSEISCMTNIQNVGSKILSNTAEMNSIIGINVEKCGDEYNPHTSRETKQVKLVENKELDYTLQKSVDELDDEIITSANNSPYVSVTDLDVGAKKNVTDDLGETEYQISANIKNASPPTSPKIVSKGYNFNFDEIDDPFATKTKIRISPTRDIPDLSFAVVPKEIKTQQDEYPKKLNKKCPIKKRSIKPTYSDTFRSKESEVDKELNSARYTLKDNVSDITLSTVSETKVDYPFLRMAQNDHKVNDNVGSPSSGAATLRTISQIDETQANDEEIKHLEQPLIISTEKSTSSSEQYFSLGTSSVESSGLMNRSKNVFNLPEIDDVNFSSVVVKSKVRMSPPLAETVPSKLDGVKKEEPDTNLTTINVTDLPCDEKITINSSPNISNSSTSKNDIDCTVREICTEDEDTVEGPFLEAEEIKNIEKVVDMEIEPESMDFDGVMQQGKDENAENGEVFIDADTFEFLLNQNKSTTVLDSGKESLFLKFDPLFAKRVSSDGIVAALTKIQKRQSTPKKITKPEKNLSLIEKFPGDTPGENETIEEYYEDLSSATTKPMMIVNPAVSSNITQRKSATPKLNRRSLTFTSPAIAVIDRLLSLSGNSSNIDHDTSIPQIGRQHTETDLVITQLRELLAEKEINVHSLRSESKELKDRLAILEGQVKDLEAESAKKLTKINELNERLFEKSKMNKSMAVVVEEYERTIASLIAETEQDKKRNAGERMKLIKERDEQTAHLTSMEISFSDLHSKYEKSKQIILSCKANEDIYKKSIQEFQDNFLKMQNNYELLKQHATSKLNHANQELEKMNRAHEAEVLKMNAMIKRKELHITSLEETLAQKTKANVELTAICDELINKVG